MAPEKDQAAAPGPDNEWDARVLCSDESCTGTIGPDGRCRVCGVIYQGDQPLPTGEGKDDLYSLDEEGEAPETEAGQGGAPSDDEWFQRKLCLDEGCIGIIGPDGRCKECGKPG
jgi:hypothetical protein